MCQCGTRTPPKPSSSPGSGASPSKPVSCSVVHTSAIQLIDELGIPIANAFVDVTVEGMTSTVQADSTGTVSFKVAPGTTVTVQLAKMQEAQAGESTVTTSGHHFKAGGTGP